MSEWEDHLANIRANDDLASQPVRKVQYGREKVVFWLMLGGILGGFLTRNVIGAIVGAALVFGGWFVFTKAFGGRMMSQKIKPSLLFRWGLIGGVAGFASSFVAGFVGLSVSVFFATVVGATAGVGLYQFVLARRPH